MTYAGMRSVESAVCLMNLRGNTSHQKQSTCLDKINKDPPDRQTTDLRRCLSHRNNETIWNFDNVELGQYRLEDSHCDFLSPLEASIVCPRASVITIREFVAEDVVERLLPEFDVLQITDSDIRLERHFEDIHRDRYRWTRIA